MGGRKNIMQLFMAGLMTGDPRPAMQALKGPKKEPKAKPMGDRERASKKGLKFFKYRGAYFDSTNEKNALRKAIQYFDGKQNIREQIFGSLMTFTRNWVKKKEEEGKMYWEPEIVQAFKKELPEREPEIFEAYHHPDVKTFLSALGIEQKELRDAVNKQARKTKNK